jgi:predicted nucleic acid-binding Zn ribbon protein
MYTHQCKKCRTTFSGRKNKQFCSKECKSDFNNDKSRKRNAHFNDTMKEIKRNRDILKKIYDVFGTNTLPLIILNATKLNFGCYTGIKNSGQTLFGEYEIRRMHNGTFYINKH